MARLQKSRYIDLLKSLIYLSASLLLLLVPCASRCSRTGRFLPGFEGRDPRVSIELPTDLDAHPRPGTGSSSGFRGSLYGASGFRRKQLPRKLSRPEQLPGTGCPYPEASAEVCGSRGVTKRVAKDRLLLVTVLIERASGLASFSLRTSTRLGSSGGCSTT